MCKGAATVPAMADDHYERAHHTRRLRHPCGGELGLSWCLSSGKIQKKKGQTCSWCGSRTTKTTTTWGATRRQARDRGRPTAAGAAGATGTRPTPGPEKDACSAGDATPQTQNKSLEDSSSWGGQGTNRMVCLCFVRRRQWTNLAE